MKPGKLLAEWGIEDRYRLVKGEDTTGPFVTVEHRKYDRLGGESWREVPDQSLWSAVYQLAKAIEENRIAMWPDGDPEVTE